jgi:putative CocE/NonD family hydrolase
MYRAACLALLAVSIVRADPPRVPATRPEHDVVVEQNVRVPMRDGVRLALDLYRPRTPYDKSGTAVEAKWFAARGYAVVVNDVRGRYASEGRWQWIVDDPADGLDLVRWIGAQPWCSGKIGTFGTSYVGGTQHALACMNPPYLACMIPVDSVSNAGVAGMRHGGAFELRFMNWIFTIGAPNARAALADPKLRSALVDNGRLMPQHLMDLPLRPGCTPLKFVPEYEEWLIEAMRHGENDAYWKRPGHSVVENVDRYADVPVYHVTGWYDSWCRQNVMNWQALSRAKKSPQKLIVGPWTHGQQRSNFAGEIEFPPEAALAFNDWRLRWFDHWLKTIDNGVEKEPPVRLFVMGGGDGRKSKAGRLQHGGRWIEANQFPPTEPKLTPFYLHGSGQLSPNKPGDLTSHTTFAFDPLNPVPTIGGNLSSYGGLGDAGGYDQRARTTTLFARDQLPLSQRRDVVVFQTPPLADDVEVIGPVAVKLFVSSSAVDTDFTAKLIDVYPPNPDYPLGFDLNIGDSIIRMRYRDSLERAELMTPGKLYEATINLYPTANRFVRGHRIRLDISSSNFARFDLNPNTGEPLQQHRSMISAQNTVYHEAGHPSHVVLPLAVAK